MTRYYDDLREIAAAAAIHQGDFTPGFEDRYGANHTGPVFDMHPDFDDDCDCGHEQQVTEWTDAHPHAADCYQHAVAAIDYDHDAMVTLAAEWKLPELGIAMHCTCGHEQIWIAWIAQHVHAPQCPIVRPNFRHHDTGVEVRWYKYIGRSTAIEVGGVAVESVDRRQWNRIVDECLDSLAS